MFQTEVNADTAYHRKVTDLLFDEMLTHGSSVYESLQYIYQLSVQSKKSMNRHNFLVSCLRIDDMQINVFASSR